MAIFTTAIQYALNKMNGVAGKYALGTMLGDLEDLVDETNIASIESDVATLQDAADLRSLKSVKAYYDFATQGGAQGNFNLTESVGGADLSIPSGSLVIGAFVHATTAVTSGGSATLAFKLEATDDLKTATGKASFSSHALVALLPAWSDPTKFVRTTASRKPVLTVGAADLTAGVLEVHLFYV